MTATAAQPTTIAPRKTLGQQAVRIMTTTDHKLIGKLYLVTSFAWFLIGGAMAMVMRSELAFPGMQVVNEELYNQLFTMHGTIMLLLFATPLFFGFGNVVMPLQIGSPDVAFPRLNMFSYWLFLFGGIIAGSGFLTPQGAADFGWFAYTPLSDAVRSPGVGGDLWVMGLWMAGLGTILGAVNFITTIICMRAPGMTMFRMPIFVWNTLVTSLLVLIAFPIFAGALCIRSACWRCIASAATFRRRASTASAWRSSSTTARRSPASGTTSPTFSMKPTPDTKTSAAGAPT